jgi:hypothetical protein
MPFPALLSGTISDSDYLAPTALLNSLHPCCGSEHPLLLLQATGGRPRNSCVQTSPQSLPEGQAEELMAAPGFAAFLETVRPG